jgi:hypothetical protein
MAIGDRIGDVELNVAANSASSSLLAMLPRHAEAAPYSRFVGTELVPMTTLADALAKHAPNAARPFVKMDVQGYERRILEASRSSLRRIAALQVEGSLVPLYDGETLLLDLLLFLQAENFTLVSVEPGFADPVSGQLLQLDALLIRM